MILTIKENPLDKLQLLYSESHQPDQESEENKRCFIDSILNSL
jgi:hypothetical protein